jgi:hypothetical protein
MKYCQSCNLDFPTKYRFCGECGGALQSFIRCEGCGELFESKWKFCTNCGKKTLPPEHPSKVSAAESPARAPSSPDRASAASQGASNRSPTQPASESSGASDSQGAATPSGPSARVRETPTREAADPLSLAKAYAGVARTTTVVSEPERPASLPSSVTGPARPLSPNPPSTKVLLHAESAIEGDELDEWYVSPDPFDEAETTAAPMKAAAIAHNHESNGRRAPELTMLSAYGRSQPDATSEWRPRSLLLAAILLLLILAVFGFGGVYWWTHRASATPPPAETNETEPSEETAAPPSSVDSKAAKPNEPVAGDPAEAEWRHLRDQGTNAKPGDVKTLLKSVGDAEKKYPKDYRFSYERARLTAITARNEREVFSALSVAAEKAIDRGKTQEMLDALNGDKDASFSKLARNDREWQMLTKALHDKNKKTLTVNAPEPRPVQPAKPAKQPAKQRNNRRRR